jgi:zinc transport system ATP-binding protein
MSALIEARGMAAGYAGLPALRDVDFSIRAGEIVTVVGPNGSGKSTLVKTLIGLLAPTAGQVRRAEGVTIGYVPQKLSIDATLPMTVERFLSLPVRRAREDVAEMLRRVGVPGLEGRQMTRLSGGQFQRVLLARALMGRPDLLILDEPTQGLDQPGVADFYRLIEEVRRTTGCAILLVSHDLHVVMSASDRVICLNGHVCCEGTPENVLRAPEYHALFGEEARGALALYQHHHDHSHDHEHAHDHGHDHAQAGKKEHAH